MKIKGDLSQVGQKWGLGPGPERKKTMEEYLKKSKRKRISKYICTTIILVLLILIVALSYTLYMNIDISNSSKIEQPKVEATRLSQTVEEIQNEEKDITQVIEEVNKSIVGISKLKNNGTTIFLEDSISKIGIGTGMIVSENGYILTNEHVSGEKYSNCYVTLPSGKNYSGNVVWSDSNLDIAVVKINAKNLPYVTLGDSSQTKVGQNVYAIGNPIGFEFQRTVTSGIVSAVNRTILLEEEEKTSYMEDLIQTDATINPGNSGGPLININGEVIGINSVKITSAEGIGFAIPINTAKVIIQSFVTTGKFDEAYLGIFAYDKSVIPYLETNLDIESGVYVVQVNKNSPAEQYGIHEKDILLEVDGNEINKMCDLRRYIYSKNTGDIVQIKLLRNRREVNIQVVLGKKN